MGPIPVVDFKSLFETLPGLYLILNPGFTIVAVSNAYLKATMTDKESIIGRGLFEVFPDNPDDKEATGVSNLRTSLNAVLKHGQPHKMAVQKYDIRRPDGVFEERYWSPLNSPVFNAAHELVYIIHNVVDVTDQHKASQKLKKSEKDYQLLVSSVKDYAIFMVDPNGLVASWNSGAASIKGYIADEIIGKPISVFYPEEDIKKGVPQSNLQTALQYGHFESEGWRLRKDGSLFWANIVITALKDEAGLFYGYSKITRDITEQKRLMEQVNHFGNIVEQSSEAIISRGIIDQRFISWNRGAEILLGYSKEEAIGKTPKEVGIIRFTGEEMAGIEKEVFENGSWKSEKEFYHKNGSSFFGAVTANAIKNAEGEITSMVFIIKDISLSKQLEDQLKKYNTELEQEVKARTEEVVKSESRFRALIENSNDVVSLMDESFRIYYRSPSAFRITGWTDADMIHADGTKNIHPDDVDKAKDIVKELMANPGKPINCLFRNQHKDGHYLWMEGVVINLLHDEYVKAIVFNFRDVTERIEAEEKLTTSEQFFRALIENSNDIITLMDDSFKVLYRSPAAARLTGWTNEDMIGVDATKNIHPEDQQHAGADVTEVMANPGKTIHSKFRMRHKTGHYLWVEGTLTNLLHDKNVKAIVFNFRDVTERIEAEAKLAASEIRFRLLIENSADGIDMSDEFSNNIYRSPGAIKITGILPKENQKGFTHPDDVETIKNLQEEFIKKPGVPIAFQARFRHALGHYIWVEGTVTNLLHIEGVKAFVTNFRDITQRKEAEHQKEFDAHNLDALINNTHDLLWSVDRDFKLITSNKAFDDMIWSMTGIMPEKGNSILLEELGERKLEHFKQYYRRAFAGEIFTEIEHDGSAEDFWSEISFYPIYEGKSVIGTACFSRDISEKKKTEEAIKKSNERFELVVTATNDIIWDWDMNSNTFWRNRNYYTHFGYDEKTVSPDSSAWHNGIHPEDKKRVLAGVKEVIKYKLHFWADEYRYLKSDNTVAFVQDSAYILYTEKDKAYRMVGAMLDITNRKKAEQEKQALAERMSIILNTLPANIALLDGHGSIIDVNDAWRNFADDNGFIGSNYCIGDNYLQISQNAFGKEKEDGKKVAHGIKAVLKNKLNEFVFEYRCDSSKIKRWFRMVVTPLQETAYAGAVVMHIDISELRMLEQERLKSKTDEQKKITKAMLIGQEKERNYIGQELHDNINQILAGTKMFLGIAGNKNKEVKELIKYPMELLDSSMEEIRTLCHKMVTPLKNVDLEELIRDLVNKFDQATKIKIRFMYAVTDGILSDELQLNIYRIIQELVNNIYKYSGAKKVSITVKAKDRAIAITVTDDGRGFDPEKKRKGVGISNMMNRIGSFNGEVEIKSSEGNGCRTSINIPY